MSWVMLTHSVNRRRNFRSRVTAAAIVCASIASLAYAPRANAVVVSGMDPLPLPDNAWVGTFNGSSCVGIGRNWFISARHVGGNVGQGIHMRGVLYAVLEIRSHPTFDIQLLRVAQDLPGYHKLAENAAYGDPAFLAGYGVTAAAALPNNAGYDWNGPRVETWGANIIEGEGSLLSVRFDPPSDPASVPHEAIFAVHDSGGGLFIMNPAGEYELAGVAVSVIGFGQAAWGSAAFALNVNLYKNWMMPIVDPETPVSSGVGAPRAALGLPGAPAWLGGAVLACSAFGSRRRSRTQGR